MMPIPSFIVRFGLITVLLCLPYAYTDTRSQEASVNYTELPKVQSFIQMMSDKHGFDTVWLKEHFAKVRTVELALRLMSAPAEKTNTWPQYRSILLDKRRISRGLNFAREHHRTLDRAASDYGVPGEIILAILGVETRYGAIQGKHRTFHSLSTLAFGYPRREKFFKQELEHFLLLAREQDFEVQEVTGSYAGAMGYGQFMPSSYRRYAVDYDNDGIKDLFGNPTDAIGSIANYLEKNGWRRGEPIAVLANTNKNPQVEIVNQGKHPKYNLNELANRGFEPQIAGPSERKGMVLSFELPQSQEYWIAYNNFSAIMSYNPRYFYAMAVYQLSQAINGGVQ
jgi:membrane-bound lytic murein transglycosylase B